MVPRTVLETERRARHESDTGVRDVLQGIITDIFPL